MTVNITPQKAMEWLQSGEAVLVDVREPDEFKAEHIAYALSLPLGMLDKQFAALLSVPSGKKILFQCRHGNRSKKACDTVAGIGDEGYEVYNVEGGIMGWKEAALPVVEGARNAGFTIFRQVQIVVGGLIAFFILLGFTGLSLAFVLAGLFGFALFMAGLTGWCGLAMLLSRMPWNR